MGILILFLVFSFASDFLDEVKTEDGCEIVREHADKFSYPFAKSKEFFEIQSKYSSPEVFYKKFGLVKPSEEQLNGKNSDLPMGFTYGKNKKYIHINCYLCHGGYVDGIPYEGAANTQLRFQELADQFKWRPLVSKAFYMSGGVVGFKNYPGSTAALDMSIIAESSRDEEDGDISYFNALKQIFKNFWSKKLVPLPVYPTPWWIFSPGLKEKRFYSTGVTDQSAIHIMQFALASNLDGEEIKKIKPLFDKILTCVKSKRPPEMLIQKNLDSVKLERGRNIFYGLTFSDEKTCECIKCHGITDKSKNSFYPEKYVSHKLVNTDFAFLEKMLDPKVGDNHKKIVEIIDPKAELYDIFQTPSYLAPPLISMSTKTALLHNRSVPTLEHLLCTDESERPKSWTWKADPNIFLSEEVVAGNQTQSEWPAYDTSKHGFSNKGHNFCSPLKNDPEACGDLVEYLKSL